MCTHYTFQCRHGTYSTFLYKIPSQAALPLPSPFGEGNSEGEYLHVQAFGFRDIKFPAVIFRPKKRSGIAVRVAERSGTWQAKRPTTHNTRSMKKNLTGDILPRYDIPKGHAIRSFPYRIFFLSHQRTPQKGTRAALAPNSAYYNFSFVVSVPSLPFFLGRVRLSVRLFFFPLCGPVLFPRFSP